MSASTKRVLLLCIDGCRAESMALFGQKLCRTFIEKPRSVYSFLCDVASVEASRAVSGPSWATILTGRPSAEHNVRGNEPKAEISDKAPSIVQVVGASRTVEVAQSTSWPGFQDILRPSSEASIHTFPLDGKDVQKWRASSEEVTAALKQAISQKADQGGASLVIGFYDMVDEVGHCYGFGPHVPEYASAVEFTAGQCAAVLDHLQAHLSQDEDWLVAVISDHGGSCTDGLRKVCPSAFSHFEKDHLGSAQVKYRGVHGIESVPSHRYVFNGFTKFVPVGAATGVEKKTDGDKQAAASTLDFECLTSLDLAPTILGFLGCPEAAALPGRNVYANA